MFGASRPLTTPYWERQLGDDNVLYATLAGIVGAAAIVSSFAVESQPASGGLVLFGAGSLIFTGYRGGVACERYHRAQYIEDRLNEPYVQ